MRAPTRGQGSGLSLNVGKTHVLYHTRERGEPGVAGDADEEDEEAGLCEFGKGKRKTPAKARAKGKKKKATGAGSGKKAVKPSRKRGRKDIEEEVEDEDAEEYLDENGIDLMVMLSLHIVLWIKKQKMK